MTNLTPRGFRDILPAEAAERERITAQVNALFAQAGYLPVETPLLEDRATLERGGRIQDAPFQLIDADDSLLMLRSDLTQPIARLVVGRLLSDSSAGLTREPAADASPLAPIRLRYVAPVVREEESLRGRERQFTQIGVELVRERTRSHAAEAEVVSLLAAALERVGLSDACVVAGSVKPLSALLEACSPSPAFTRDVLACVHASDFVDLDAVVMAALRAGSITEPAAEALRRLPRLHGGSELLAELDGLLAAAGVDERERGVVELRRLMQSVDAEARLSLDFSIISSFDYYTGVVFKAYVPGMPWPVASGGRYDSVYANLGRPGLSACGFACSLDNLVAACAQQAPGGTTRPLRIAVPKGSLFKPALAALAAAGCPTEELANPGRKLILDADTPFGPVQYVIVRATDAPAFVAFGGADLGLCGRDSLVEAGLDLVQLWDLGFGGCRFVVAEPAGAHEATEAAIARRGTVRVASKYPRITQDYYARVGQQVDVVALHGNIELGPIIGLADRIVDITATGTTLAENDLVIVDEVMECTARLFASPTSYRQDARVRALAQALGERVAVSAAETCGGPLS